MGARALIACGMAAVLGLFMWVVLAHIFGTAVQAVSALSGV